MDRERGTEVQADRKKDQHGHDHRPPTKRGTPPPPPTGTPPKKEYLLSSCLFLSSPPVWSWFDVFVTTGVSCLVSRLAKSHGLWFLRGPSVCGSEPANETSCEIETDGTAGTWTKWYHMRHQPRANTVFECSVQAPHDSAFTMTSQNRPHKRTLQKFLLPLKQ